MLLNIKLLFQDFFDFVRKDFNVRSYAYTLLLMALVIALAYGFKVDDLFSRGAIFAQSRMLSYLLFYSALYYMVAIPILVIKREHAMLTDYKFYLKSFVFLCILSLADSAKISSLLNWHGNTPIESRFISKTCAQLDYLVFMLPPLLLIRIFFDKKVKGLYGLCLGNHHVKAYLSLYLVVVPILIVTSFTPDFLSFYPVYKPWWFQDVFGRPTWLNTVIFESLYAADFTLVEMFFRGALVIGMAAILGRNAVLPMVAVYVGLHFGKPVLETMSAIFGGYFLGALAFQTRHIWGGVIIHMGVAVMIELLRFFEHYVLHVG